MSRIHSGKVQSLKQFRVELIASTPNHELSVIYQKMPLTELKVLAELRNTENDQALMESRELKHSYIDLGS